MYALEMANDLQSEKKQTEGTMKKQTSESRCLYLWKQDTKSAYSATFNCSLYTYMPFWLQGKDISTYLKLSHWNQNVVECNPMHI